MGIKQVLQLLKVLKTS